MCGIVYMIQQQYNESIVLGLLLLPYYYLCCTAVPKSPLKGEPEVGRTDPSLRDHPNDLGGGHPDSQHPTEGGECSPCLSHA